MIKKADSKRSDTLVLHFENHITIDEVNGMQPLIDELEKKHDKINLIIFLNAEGESFGAFMKQFWLGIKHWNKLHKIAFVGNKNYWKYLVPIDNAFTKFSEKYFDDGEVESAWKWLDE